MIGHWALDWWFVTLVQPGGPWSGLPYQMRVEGVRPACRASPPPPPALFGARGLPRAGALEQPAFAMLWARSRSRRPIVMLIAVYYRVTQFERSIPFAGLALLLAALFALATEKLWKREPRPGIAAAGAMFATGAVAGLALTLTFALEKGWLTVALSLMVPGIAWIADAAAAAAAAQAVRPLVVLVMFAHRLGPAHRRRQTSARRRSSTGCSGATACRRVSFWIAGRLLRRRGDDLSSRSVEFGRDPVHRAAPRSSRSATS